MNRILCDSSYLNDANHNITSTNNSSTSSTNTNDTTDDRNTNSKDTSRQCDHDTLLILPVIVLVAIIIPMVRYLF